MIIRGETWAVCCSTEPYINCIVGLLWRLSAHVGHRRVWLFKEFKCPSFVDSYFYFPGGKTPVWHGQRVTEAGRWRMLKEEWAAAPIPAKILILGTNIFSCEEAAYRETEGQTTVHTVLQKSHIPHVSLIHSDTASIPLDVSFLGGFFGVCHLAPPKMSISDAANNAINECPITYCRPQFYSILFYSILFYSILFYSILFLCCDKNK